MIEPGFIDRVYKTGVFVWALGFVLILAKYGFGAASGWSAGAAFSFALLGFLQWFIRKTLVPENKKAKKNMTAFVVLQIPVLLVTLGAVVYMSRFIPGFIVAFCAGVGLVQMVIAFKAAGIYMLEKFK